MEILSKYLNKKISTPIGIIVIVFFALLFGGFLIWQCKIVPRESKMPGIEGPERETEGEISDWKTYRNEKRGFEINYPPEWKVVVDLDDPYSSMFHISLCKEISCKEGVFSIGINLWFDRPIDPMCRFAGEEISVAGNRVSPEIVSYFKSKPSNIEEMRGEEFREEFRRACQTQPLRDDHSVYLDMCFDENLNYLGDYCDMEGPIFYYQFSLHCEGADWQGREGMNKCSQLFSQIISTFRFIKEEEAE